MMNMSVALVWMLFLFGFALGQQQQNVSLADGEVQYTTGVVVRGQAPPPRSLGGDDDESEIPWEKIGKFAAGITEGGLESSKDVYNGLRKLTLFGIGYIPVAGDLIKAVVSFFWPAKKETVWQQVERQVNKAIDCEIFKKEQKTLGIKLTAYKVSLQYYATAKTTEKQAIMGALLVSANEISLLLKDSYYSHRLLPITVSFAMLHLFVLKERYDRGQEIYGENNRVVWLKELKDTYEAYRRFFAKAYTQWKEWRSDQIEYGSYTTGFWIHTAHGWATDAVTKNEIRWSQGLKGVDNYWMHDMKTVRDMWMNNATAQMAAVLTPFWTAHRLIPGRASEPPQVLPELQHIWLGPFSGNTLGQTESCGACWMSQVDVPDATEVTGVYLRAGNTVDYMQFTFADEVKGVGLGVDQNGKQYGIQLPPGTHIAGTQMLWAKGADVHWKKGREDYVPSVLAGVKLIYVNETDDSSFSTEWFGNEGGYDGDLINDTVGGGLYQLSGASGSQYVPSSYDHKIFAVKHRFSVPDAMWEEIREGRNLYSMEDVISNAASVNVALAVATVVAIAGGLL